MIPISNGALLNLLLLLLLLLLCANAFCSIIPEVRIMYKNIHVTTLWSNFDNYNFD